MTIWIFAGLFFLILAALAVANYKLNNEFKIDTSWMALGLAPVVIWLLTTQQLSEFSGFGLAFKLKEATAKPVSMKFDGNLIKPEHISADAKGGMGKIQTFIKNKIAAITLTVGRTGYYGNWAIEEYLKELTPHPFFKYVLFMKESGEFVGIVDAGQLLHEMQNNGLDVVKYVENSDVSSIPGVRLNFISIGSSKETSLQMMDEQGLSELPVVDEQRHFIGIVERDKITSSIVAQLVSSSGG
jgi:CBS domain-containing protein